MAGLIDHSQERRFNMRIMYLVGALIASICHSPSSVLAQGSTGGQGTAGVAIVLLSDLTSIGAPQGTAAVVMRSPAKVPHNFVLVTRSTTPHDLAYAMRVLQRARRQQGHVPTREVRTFVEPRPQPENEGQDTARAARDLGLLLRGAGLYDVPGIGSYPAVISLLGPLRGASR